MNLIDKDDLVAELKNRIQDHLDAGGGTSGVYLSERMKEDSYILSFIDTLDVLSKPSLPSDLDEAAKEYECEYTENDNGNGGEDWEDDIRITFIAGAEWMAKQLPLPEDSVAFQKGVQEGRRLEREDVKSLVQSRIDEILGDAQPNPILRMELQELIKKIEA